MNFVDDQRIGGGDVAFFEPSPGDASGDDDELPLGRLRRRLALAVDDTDLERLAAEDLLRDGTDGERLSCSGASNDSKSAPGSSELANAFAVVLLEERLDVELHRELDGL